MVSLKENLYYYYLVGVPTIQYLCLIPSLFNYRDSEFTLPAPSFFHKCTAFNFISPYKKQNTFI